MYSSQWFLLHPILDAQGCPTTYGSMKEVFFFQYICTLLLLVHQQLILLVGDLLLTSDGKLQNNTEVLNSEKISAPGVQTVVIILRAEIVEKNHS